MAKDATKSHHAYCINVHIILLLAIKLTIINTANSFPTITNTNPERYTPLFMKRISDPYAIRGDKYGTDYNSTIPTPEEVADLVGVKPPLEASKRTWKRAWKILKFAAPILHMPERIQFSRNNRHEKTVNSSLNLYCLWWKALSGNDTTSPAFDEGLSFDLLPKATRHVVNRFWVKTGIYPKLHHANVEIRTVFLDSAVKDVIQMRKTKVKDENGDESKVKFRLISMGAGYDIRSVKLLTNGVIDKAYEIDLPDVVESKKTLLKRLRKRRPHLTDEQLPELVGIDLNSVSDFEQVLQSILCKEESSSNNQTKDGNVVWHNIFLFEAVLAYLDEGVSSKLLQACSTSAREVLQSSGENNLTASLCLADRMENVPGGDEEMGMMELKRNGWDLVTWLPKPGIARHMCSASLL